MRSDEINIFIMKIEMCYSNIKYITNKYFFILVAYFKIILSEIFGLNEIHTYF